MRNFAPQMEKDMQSYRLSDLVKIKNGKDHKMLSNGQYPVLGSGGIMRYVDKFLYDKPSVLLPRKGTLDNIQYCDMPFWTVDTLYYTEVNTNLANPYYLYRYLSLLDLSNLDSGTGVPSMTFDNYYGLKIFLPNIEKQTKIAQILQTLDKKITINRQINQNLPKLDIHQKRQEFVALLSKSSNFKRIIFYLLKNWLDNMPKLSYERLWCNTQSGLFNV